MADFSTQREDCKFHMGIQNVDQLETWLLTHPEIKGFAMVGRSNVGKSSLINTIFGSKTAKTSKTPGRTQQINIFKFRLRDLDESLNNEFYLFDLPGYGHANVSKEMTRNWNLLIDCFFQTLPESVLLCQIQDARHPQQKADQDFQQYIKTFDVPSILIFNKIDKLKKQKERAALNKVKPLIFKEYKQVKGIYFVSAENKTELDPLKSGIINELIQFSLQENPLPQE